MVGGNPHYRVSLENWRAAGNSLNSFFLLLGKSLLAGHISPGCYVRMAIVRRQLSRYIVAVLGEIDKCLEEAYKQYSDETQERVLGQIEKLSPSQAIGERAKELVALRNGE